MLLFASLQMPSRDGTRNASRFAPRVKQSPIKCQPTAQPAPNGPAPRSRSGSEPKTPRRHCNGERWRLRQRTSPCAAVLCLRRLPLAPPTRPNRHPTRKSGPHRVIETSVSAPHRQGVASKGGNAFVMFQSSPKSTTAARLRQLGAVFCRIRPCARPRPMSSDDLEQRGRISSSSMRSE